MGLNLRKLGSSLIDLVSANTEDDKKRRAQAAQRAVPQDVRNKLANAKYGVLANNKARQQQFTQSLAPTNRNEFADQFRQTGTGLGLGGVRSGTGLAQGVSGLYDLATPGLGTNRFSQGLDRFAKSVDQTAQAEGVGASYKIGQFGTDALTFGLGGLPLKAASKIPVVAKATAPLGKVSAPISKVVDKGAVKLAAKGTGGRVAAAGLKGAASKSNLANVAAGSLYDIGAPASKGRDVSPTTVATSVGINSLFGAGLPASGQVLKEFPGAAKSVVGGVEKAIDKPLQRGLSQAQLQERNKAVVAWNKAKDAGKENAAAFYAKKIQAIDNQTDQVGAVGKNIRDNGAPIEKTPNKPDINAEMVAAQAAEEAKIMKSSGLEGVRQKGRKVSSRAFNPYSEAERLTKRAADAKGVSLKNVNASDDLAHQLDVVANSSVAAKQLALDTGLADVIARHKPNTPEEAQFVNYMTMKRDLDVRVNKGKKILPYETKDLEAAVAAYERGNPIAKQDLATVNNHFKVLLKNALDAGTITKADYDKALRSENFYAPIARVLGSEDVLRPTINANVKGGLTTQSALRSLSGSDKPVDTTWKAIYEATAKVTRENARNKAFGVMYSIADKKLVDDMARMGFSKEKSQSLIELRNTIDELQNVAASAKMAAKTAGKEARKVSKKATAYNNRVQDNAIARIATTMEAVDPDGAAALRKLNRKDQAELTGWLQNGMTDTEITRGIAIDDARRTAYDNLMSLRAQAEGLIAETGAAKRSAREIQLLKNEKTGRQVVNGFVDGYPVWLEVTPEMAEMVQGLNQRELGSILKGLTNVQRVWRTFWTGLFNPIFAAKSKVFYDLPMLVLNQSGSRNQLRPSVLAGSFGDNFKSQNDFFKELQRHGVSPVTGSRIMGDTKQSVELLAAHNDFQSKLAYYAKHPTAGIEALDVFGGKVAHSSRMQAARAEYQKALANKLSKQDAIENAARAYNNVLPNYARTSHFLRQLDALIPYANAGVAGTRAMTTAMRNDPVGWGVKAGTMATALAAAGVYAMGDDTTREFYQDMYDSNKQSILQNNIVFALPGAKKDPQTGEWTGIVKLPLPPEFRAPNALIQDTAFKAKGGEADGYNPVVGSVATMATGGIANVGKGGGVNVETNPFINAALELGSNKQNSGMGESFAYGDAQFAPRSQQANPDTSQLAISGANLFNKLPVGDISPAALDAQLKTFGAGGKVIRSVGSSLTKNENTTAKQLPGTDIKKSIVGVISADGTKGMTDAKWHFKNQDAVAETLGTKALRDQFAILNSKNDSPGDSQAKSQLLYESLQSDGKLWDAQKKQNDLDAERGGISNPLFSLTPEQARAVTLYRGNARLNAAKQAYAKDGSSLFESLGLDEKWYQDFKKEESVYWDKISAKQGEDKIASAKTYSGQAYTEPSRVIQSKLDAYYALPAKSAARKAFLAANPDVIQYWNNQNSLANEERVAMGLDLLGTDKYGSSKGGGSSSSSSSKSSNKYKYAVSASAGGAIAKPKIKSKKTSFKGGKVAAGAKPKVTVKKSLV